MEHLSEALDKSANNIHFSLRLSRSMKKTECINVSCFCKSFYIDIYKVITGST